MCHTPLIIQTWISTLNKLILEMPAYRIKGSLTLKFNIFIIQFREKCSKQNIKKTFRENVFVCKDFSLNRKENELHRKYMVLGATENGMANFRDRTKWLVPLDLARLRVYNSIFFSFIFENKFYKHF